MSMIGFQEGSRRSIACKGNDTLYSIEASGGMPWSSRLALDTAHWSRECSMNKPGKAQLFCSSQC